MNTLNVEEEPAYGQEFLQTFFSDFSLSDAIQYTQSILAAAASRKVWKHSVPCNLLFFIKNFKALL